MPGFILAAPNLQFWKKKKYIAKCADLQGCDDAISVSKLFESPRPQVAAKFNYVRSLVSSGHFHLDGLRSVTSSVFPRLPVFPPREKQSLAFLTLPRTVMPESEVSHQVSTAAIRNLSRATRHLCAEDS